MNKNLLLSVVLTVTMLNYQPEAFAEIIAGSDNCSKTTQLGQNYSYTTIRYTLPEADALTSNDNENRIEWIFE